MVTVDGVVQRAPVHYTTTGNTITFTSSPPAGANVHVRHLGFRTTQAITQIAANSTIPSPTITGTISGSITVDSSGNLGVGTASPATKFHVSDTTTNTVKERIQASTGYVEVGMGGSSGVFDTTAADGIRLRMGGVDKVAIDGSTFSLSGLQGIKFQASQSASTDANTLDDYEEGTWTPALTFSGGTTGITYSQQVGTYVKFGRLVWLNCRVALTAKGSSSGSARITGLPYATTGGNSGNEIIVGAVWYNAFTNASNYHINIRQDAGAAYLELRAYASGSELIVDQTWFNNSSQVSITILNWTTA
jgi:hypothetical protein